MRKVSAILTPVINKRILVALSAVLICCFCAPGSEATVLIETDLTHLTTKADLIFAGTVSAIDSGWDDSHSKIWTHVTFSVNEVIKGNLADNEITIRLPGGTVAADNIQMKVDGVPQFTVGEEALIFYSNDPKQMCPIIGWYQGRFKIRFDEALGEKVVEGRAVDKIIQKRRALAGVKETPSGVTYRQFTDEIKRVMEQTGLNQKQGGASE